MGSSTDGLFSQLFIASPVYKNQVNFWSNCKALSLGQGAVHSSEAQSEVLGDLAKVLQL